MKGIFEKVLNCPLTLTPVRKYRPQLLLANAKSYSSSYRNSLPDNNVSDPATPKRTSIKEILNSRGAEDTVRVQGWVRSLRKQKLNVFFDVSDGSSFHKIPVVSPTKSTPLDLSMHCSVDVTGVLVNSPKNPALLEIHPSSPVQVIGPCDQKKYPFGGKIRYEPDYLRQHLHLRAKTNKFSSLFRIRSAATRAISNYFFENDFVQVHTPVLTSNDCEGAGEVFLVRPANDNLMLEKPNLPPKPVAGVVSNIQTDAHADLPDDGAKYTHSHECKICQKVFQHTHSKKSLAISQSYDNHYCEDHKEHRKSQVNTLNPDELFFGCKTFLTVSAQLHLEAMANGLDKVWTFSPVFRSENARSTRHLSEFYMVEAEIGFAYEIDQILAVMENLVKYVIRSVVYDNNPEWAFCTESNQQLQSLLEKILKNPFTVMTFEEASNLLLSKADSRVNPDCGLSREQELLLVENINGGIPVFVIDWPSEIKPFYVRRNRNNSSLCAAVDLLVPGVGELIGGSLRENDLSLLIDRSGIADSTGQLQKSLEWYFSLRKYGGVPSGGFGLGFDRLMLLLVGSSNIKDVTLFPRWPHNCPM